MRLNELPSDPRSNGWYDWDHKAGKVKNQMLLPGFVHQPEQTNEVSRLQP